MQPLLINVFQHKAFCCHAADKKSQQRGHIQGETKKQIMQTIQETFKEILENIWYLRLIHNKSSSTDHLAKFYMLTKLPKHLECRKRTVFNWYLIINEFRQYQIKGEADETKNLTL